jgi:hypothetical protein
MAAGAAIAISLAIIPRLLEKLRNPVATDFGIFYAAGRLVDVGHPMWAYSIQRLNDVELSAGGHALNLFFPYPPYVMSFLAPLSRLGLGPAFVVWSLANVAAFLCAAIVAWRRLQPPWRLVGGTIMLSCLPLVVNTAQGENGGFVALGLALVLSCVHTAGVSPIPRREFGLVIGVALLAMKPQFLLVPLIVIAIRHQRRDLILTASTLFGLFCLGLLAGGLDGYIAFAKVLQQGLTAGGTFHWGAAYNYTLQSEVQGIIGRNLASTIVWMGLAAVALLCLGLPVFRSQAWTASTRAGVPNSAWLPVGATMMLANTHAMYHDLAFLYPALALALGVPKLRWTALSILGAIILDPMVYPALGFHLVVLSLASVLVVTYWDQLSALVRTIGGVHLGGSLTGSWKSFAPMRWGSVSGSEMPLR